MHKVLFVDDEPAILDGLARMLRREFEVDTAVGGENGLKALADRGPFSVVVSDMRMPGMNGAQLLSHVRERSPETVRMLLTGYADIEAVAQAVNQGNIFRFLGKPCEREQLLAAVADGCTQYDLIRCERDLLEKTLMGSVKAMTDVMSAANPEVFGRSVQIASYMRHLLKKFPVSQPWRCEVAATLSQLGCVTLDPELVRNAFHGAALTKEQEIRFLTHPGAAAALIGHIPRLEDVAWMIAQQLAKSPPAPPQGFKDADQLLLGANLLRVCVAMAATRPQESTNAAALQTLRPRMTGVDRPHLEGLIDFQEDTCQLASRRVSVQMLTAGMTIDQEVRTQKGILVVAPGQQVTVALALRLENFYRAGVIEREIQVLSPK